MEEWKTYKLGDLVNLYSGGTPNKSKAGYWGGSIPWISAKSMYEDFLSTSDLFITESGLKAGSKLAKKDTILLLTRGSGLFNRIPVCWTERDLAFNQDVKNIVSKDDSVLLNQYLYYWLYGNKAGITAILETTGIGAGKIDTERFLSLDVSIPSVDEQNRIIKIVEPIFDKIAINNRINHNLEEQVQALYKSWFVDFEPFKGEEYIESEIGMIPSSCKVLRLQDVCELITKGTTPTSLGLRFSDDGIPFVKVESISDAHTLDEGKFAFIAAEANEALSRSKIKSGDILFTIAGTLGRFCLVPKRISQANTNQAVSIIRVDQTILPVEYVYSLLLGGYHIDYCTRNIQQAVQANLSLGTLKNLPIIIPRPDKLEQYCLTVMQLINGIELKKDETRLLSISRDSILPKLMSGCLSC